jgi:hypothetical protein
MSPFRHAARTSQMLSKEKAWLVRILSSFPLSKYILCVRSICFSLSEISLHVFANNAGHLVKRAVLEDCQGQSSKFETIHL